MGESTRGMRRLGIVAHSAEGASLCFITACRHAATRLGSFMHPDIVMSAVPMGLSMEAWRRGDHAEVGRYLRAGVRMVADAGADLWVCPDNTAHIVLEEIAEELPIPGLHIAEVACATIERRGFRRVGLTGTAWTMTGPVYERALAARGLERIIPDELTRERIDDAIFSELCEGVITEATTSMFVDAVRGLSERGAECVVLGCTEIPLVLTADNSPLPVVDSTRLLARAAADACIDAKPTETRGGWLVL